jgi:autotransporter-associated beta strand protein
MVVRLVLASAALPIVIFGPQVSAQNNCQSASPGSLAFAQNFCQPLSPEGPAPGFGPADAAASRDAAPSNGSFSGAVQAVLPVPGNTGSIFIGSVNGGIWTTTNGGATWKPLTDNQPSLSIASLAYNSTNPSILYAGIGTTSSIRQGGVAAGVMESVDGGATWTTLNLGGVAGSGLLGKTVIGIAGSGTGANQTILAATWEPENPTAGNADGYGLYISAKGGTFTLLNPASGSSSNLPPGGATALVGQGTPAEPYYVAINAETTVGKTSTIFQSINGGSTWTQVLTGGQNQIGRLAIAPNGAVAAMFTVANPKGSGSVVAGLEVSQNGTTWTTLDVTKIPLNPADHFALGIDPNNTQVVYVAGDTKTPQQIKLLSNQFTTDAYRVTSQNGTTVATTLTDSGTADNSSAHADSRAFAFDASGNLLMANDGGLYIRTAPLSNTGIWTGLNGTSGGSTGLQLQESNAVAFDAVSKRLLVAAQDVGVSVQAEPRNGTFTPLLSADGINAAINDRTFRANGESIQYYNYQNLGFLTRDVVNSQGIRTSQLLWTQGGPTLAQPEWNFVPADFGTPPKDEAGNELLGSTALPFGSKFILSRSDPTRIAIGTNFVYVTTDSLITNTQCTPNTSFMGNPCVKNVLTNVGTATGTGNAIGVGQVTALAYGTNDPASPNALLAGTTGDDVNPAAPNINRLFYSPTASAGTLSPVPGYTGVVPTSIVFDPNSASRYYIADGTNVWGFSSGMFTSLTLGLTNLNISQPTALEFISNNGVNALLVGGLGVNPTTLAMAQSPIAVATVPTVPAGGIPAPNDWKSFGQGLAQALPTTMVNYLSYNPAVDVLAASLLGRGIWTLYDVTTYFPTATVLRYGLADNDSTPDASFLTGVRRPLEKMGAGTLTIDGAATYTGTSTVFAGTMVVNGTIASSSNLMVNANATVRGTGILPMTAVNGTLWPGGNGPGTLTVNDKLTFGAGGTYMVDASSQGTSHINVVKVAAAGTAVLDGTVAVNLQPGGFGPGKTFSILTAAGGVSGTFAGISNSLPFLHATLFDDANDVLLSVAPGGFAAGGLSTNQIGVGNALDRSVASSSGDFASVLDALSAMSASQAPAVLDAISGQPYANLGSTYVQTGSAFLNSFGNHLLGLHAGPASTSVAISQARTRAPSDYCTFDCETAAEAPRYGAWLTAVGGTGSVPGDSDAASFTYNFGGTAGGADYRLNPELVVGLGGGWTSGTQWVSGFAGQAYINTFSGLLYASWTPGALYLDGTAGYANSRTDMTRIVAIPGLAPRIAQGQTSANQFLGQVEIGYKLALPTRAPTSVAPFVQLQGSTTNQHGFTESGANSLDLVVGAQTTNSLRTTLGADFAAHLPIADHSVNFDFRLGWLHEYADTGRPMNASFAGAPGSPSQCLAPRHSAIVRLSAFPPAPRLFRLPSSTPTTMVKWAAAPTTTPSPPDCA